MVSSSFASGGRGDDRSVHRTLAVGKHVLDMGYRSMVLDNVSSVLSYQPPRVSVAKLFFALFALIFGALGGALYTISALWIAVGAVTGLVIGLLPLIPKPPTSLMITGSDGGAAVFESNDLQFLQRVKAFLDARINQNDLAMTGFFDFANSRYSSLHHEGTYVSPADDAADDAYADDTYADDAYEEVVDTPAARREPEAPPPPRRAPQPAPAPAARPAAPAPAAAAPVAKPAAEDDLDLAADDVTGGKADIHATAANGARSAHFESLDGKKGGGSEDDDEPAEETLPPIDFTRVMPQLAHVRRFYDETLQDADAVDQLDTMIVLMEEGAITQHSRNRILEIASTMQEQVETYPSIASIFAGIASRVRV